MRFFLLILSFSFILNSCVNKNDAAVDVVAKNIDTTVNPSDDFFAFACGGWIKNNAIPDAYSSWGIGNLVQEQVWEQLKAINENAVKHSNSASEEMIGNFYAAAMDTMAIENAGINAIQADLNKIDQLQNKEQLPKLIAYLHTIGVPTFFDIGIYQDAMNSEVNRLYIWQGGIGLPNRDYYFNTDKRTVDIRKEYQNNFINKLCGFAGIQNKAIPIYNLEESLAKNSRKLEDLRDPYANYNPNNIEQLQLLTPNFKWSDFFLEANIKNIDTVIVGQPEFLKNVEKLIQITDINTIKAYLKYCLVNSYATYLHKEIDQAEFNFYSKLIKGKKEQLPRWKRALIWEEDAIGEELGKLYVKENFSEKTKQRYIGIVKNVMNAYEKRIKQLDWMSVTTKEKAIAKLHAITYKVGYPDKWKDFSNLKITKSSLIENEKQVAKYWFQYQVDKLYKPVDRTEWDMTPQTYNAYYNPSNNEIVLPAAIFAIPGFKDEKIDDAVIYGYAGASTIGHEITHGFDDEGRQFDAKGNLSNWWTKEDEAKFTEIGSLYINYFNGMKVLDSIAVNGEATLGENIADLGGIAIGLDAFKQTEQYKQGKTIACYTPLQRYFLGYALGWMMHMRDEELASRILTDVHAPYFLRVNGPFSHIDDFYTAFNIPENSKMYIPKEKRIKIW